LSDAVGRGFTVTELASVAEPPEPAPETTAAFVGRSLRGPVDQPVLISSFADFLRRFGDVWTRSELGPAVEQFFEHGGRRAYVVRIANKARGAFLCLPAGGSALVLRALEPGSTERIRAAVDYDGIRDDDTRFNLTIQRIDPRTRLVRDQEFHRRASIVPGSEGFIVDSLLASTIARVESPLPTQRPDSTGSIDAARASPYVEHAQDGSDGAELSDYDIVGSRRRQTGLFALDAVPRFDILYIPPPGRDRDPGPTSVLAADRYCRERGAMLIVDPRADWDSPAAAMDGIRELGYSSPDMLSYFPRMRHRDERPDTRRAVGGAIAGQLCRLDRTAGPWRRLDESGIGFRNRYLPAVVVDDAAALALTRAGLNCIRYGRSGSPQLTGSVTLGRRREARPDCASLHVRRLALRMIAAIDRFTRPAVFASGGNRLAESIEDDVVAYLDALTAMGAIEEWRQLRCELRSGRPAAANDITVHVVVAPAGRKPTLSIALHQGAEGCRAALDAVGHGRP
jgi:hypothetical protein